MLYGTLLFVFQSLTAQGVTPFVKLHSGVGRFDFIQGTILKTLAVRSLSAPPPQPLSKQPYEDEDLVMSTIRTQLDGVRDGDYLVPLYDCTMHRAPLCSILTLQQVSTDSDHTHTSI